MSLHKAQQNPAILGLNSIIEYQLETLSLILIHEDPYGGVFCIAFFIWRWDTTHGFHKASSTQLDAVDQRLGSPL